MLQVKIQFDEKKALKHGYSVDALNETVQKAFLENNILCETQQNVMIFHDNDREEDYGYMWGTIFSLVEAPWFLYTAKCCEWHKEDYVEDVLSLAYRDAGLSYES